MVVAKSNRRKRQDRVKVAAKRAEQTRRRAKAEREQQTAARYRRLLAGAHMEAEPGERERTALTRYGDRSGSEALREAIDAFLGRTEWGATTRKWADAEQSRLEAEYWQAAERDQFDALAVEVGITYPVAGFPDPRKPTELRLATVR
jgi:hypothetical protein